jgi:hypothetical protein
MVQELIISATVAGTVNTGGGGGGSGGSFAVARAGGSGVVILRMPTASYSGTVYWCRNTNRRWFRYNFNI